MASRCMGERHQDERRQRVLRTDDSGQLHEVSFDGWRTWKEFLRGGVGACCAASGSASLGFTRRGGGVPEIEMAYTAPRGIGPRRGGSLRAKEPERGGARRKGEVDVAQGVSFTALGRGASRGGGKCSEILRPFDRTANRRHHPRCLGVTTVVGEDLGKILKGPLDGSHVPPSSTTKGVRVKERGGIIKEQNTERKQSLHLQACNPRMN